MAHYLHHIPGRLRIRSPRLKRNPLEGAAAKATLAGVTGIRTVASNHVTGSLTITYDPSCLPGSDLTALLRQKGYLTPALPAARARADAGTALGDRLVKTAVGVVVEKVLERSVASLIAAVV